MADNATAVELLKSEQASKWGEREAAHAAEAGGLREELASTQAKAAEEVERLKSSHKQEMEEQLQASGASESEGAQALKEARERNEEHLKKVTEEHIAAIEKFKADNTAMAARAEEIRKNQELESKAKLEQLQRDSDEQLEKEKEVRFFAVFSLFFPVLFPFFHRFLDRRWQMPRRKWSVCRAC